MAKSYTKLRFPLALGLGIVCGLLTGLILRVLGPGLSVLAGIGGFIIGTAVFRWKKRDTETGIDGIDGITKEMLDKALKEGYEKIAKLRAGMIRIENQSVRLKTENICTITGKILENIKNDPKDLKPARHFLNYYLDTTTQIVQQYSELISKKADSPEIHAVLEKTERTLTSLESAYEKQLEALLENDVMDLDTEVTVLEKTLQMEGFTVKKTTKGEKDE